MVDRKSSIIGVVYNRCMYTPLTIYSWNSIPLSRQPVFYFCSNFVLDTKKNSTDVTSCESTFFYCNIIDIICSIMLIKFDKNMLDLVWFILAALLFNEQKLNIQRIYISGNIQPKLVIRNHYNSSVCVCLCVFSLLSFYISSYKTHLKFIMALLKIITKEYEI